MATFLAVEIFVLVSTKMSYWMLPSSYLRPRLWDCDVLFHLLTLPIYHKPRHAAHRYILLKVHGFWIRSQSTEWWMNNLRCWCFLCVVLHELNCSLGFLLSLCRQTMYQACVIVAFLIFLLVLKDNIQYIGVKICSPGWWHRRYRRQCLRWWRWRRPRTEQQ